MYKVWLLTKIKVNLIFQKSIAFSILTILLIVFLMSMAQNHDSTVKIGISKDGDPAVMELLRSINSQVIEVQTIDKNEALRLLSQRKIELYLQIFPNAQESLKKGEALFESYYLRGNLFARFLIDKVTASLVSVAYQQSLKDSLSELAFATQGFSQVPDSDKIFHTIIHQANTIKQKLKDGKYFIIEVNKNFSNAENRNYLSGIATLMICTGIFWILLSYFALKILSIHHKNDRIKVIGFKQRHQIISTMLVFLIPVLAVSICIYVINFLYDSIFLQKLFFLGKVISAVFVCGLISFVKEKNVFLVYSFLTYLSLMAALVWYYVL